MARTLFLGIDAGGTFTDFICLEMGSPPRIRQHKTLSTPAAPEQAILAGIAALRLDRLEEGDRLHIIHGSTVATNALLENKLAKTALVCNRGFADLLTLARQTRPQLYALEFEPVSPPVPVELCLEIGGRLAADGSEVEAMEDEDIEQLLRQLKALEPESVAINLLFSFLDASHEERIAARLREQAPELFVCTSASVLPVYKEYERGVATWLNAALGPVINGYLKRLRQQLGTTPLQIMQSDGETLAAEQAAESAVHLLLSGPAGGLTAMAFLGAEAEDNSILSFDMGGTSTDVALIRGRPEITTESAIGPYPIAVPTVDMHTIGAGGGSIAFIDKGGMLQVGPRSAGADPGPACYGRGGHEATVTDANVVLGRLPSAARLAGGLQLQPELARQALATLAQRIGLSLEETALGIVTIANEHMARAIRMISVNRGHDPADFLLASFGGAGGLHVCAVAEAMGMQCALVPVHGGVLSALGMLAADSGRQFAKTVSVLAGAAHAGELEDVFQSLADSGRQQLLDEGLALASLGQRRSADLRYRGQSYTLTIPWQSLPQSLEAFDREHRRRYGYDLDAEIEIVNLRVNVFAAQQQLQLPPPIIEREANPGQCHIYGHSDPVPMRTRASLAADEVLPGPAVVMEDTATTYVAPGWQLRRDRLGSLRLARIQA